MSSSPSLMPFSVLPNSTPGLEWSLPTNHSSISANDDVIEHTFEPRINRAAGRRHAERGSDSDHPAAQAGAASEQDVPAIQFFDPKLVVTVVRSAEPDDVV